MKIFAVDDEKLTLYTIVEAAKEAEPDAEIRSFSNPLEFLEEASKERPDIALIDVQMPGMTGIELAEKLRKAAPKINIIFVTAYPDYTADAMRIFSSGYVMKPVSAENLKEQFENLRFPVKEKLRYKAIAFGHFAFFVDDAPISFHRSSSKEMLAYLISKRGAFVSRSELSLYMFEDSTYERKYQKLINDAAYTLEKDLSEVEANEIIIRSSEGFAVNSSMIDCDLYRYMDGEKELYKGEFMEQYSWGEYFKGKEITE